MKLQLHKKGLLRRLERQPARGAGSPACHAVFTTAELLEAILLLLDSRTLLVSAQRVCTTWRDLIGASFRLQDALFLRPPPCHSVPSPKLGLTLQPPPMANVRQFHPLIQAAFGPLLREGLDTSPVVSPEQQQHYWMFGMEGMVEMHLPIAKTSGRHARHKPFVRRGASWRRMHVCQPPIHRVGYVASGQQQQPPRRPSLSSSPATSSSSSHQSDHQILHFPEGLRMGEFYDLLDAIVWGTGREDRGRHYAWVSWDPARTRDALVRTRDMPTVQRAVSDWLGDGDWDGADAVPKVDIVIGESATPRFSAKCDFYNVRADVEDKVEDAAWMFRCKDFKQPCLALEA